MRQITFSTAATLILAALLLANLVVTVVSGEKQIFAADHIEYKVVRPTEASLQSVLTELGKERWELVLVMPESRDYVFKR